MRGAWGLLASALLAILHAQAPARRAERAQVGPLQAWVARGASGVCQVRLRNTGESIVEAWNVTVRSADARHTMIVEHDGWRDAYHLPSAALRLQPGDTRAFTVHEDGAAGDLDVEIHLVVQADGTAYGMEAASSHVARGERILARMIEGRRKVAEEAERHVDIVQASIGRDGVARVLAHRVASSTLENEGDWNWWRVREVIEAAEALPPGDPAAADRLSAALDLLREAHRRGMAPVALAHTDPLMASAVGRCDR